MDYYVSRNHLLDALNEAQIEYDENYKGLGKAKEIASNLPTVSLVREFERINEDIENIRDFIGFGDKVYFSADAVHQIINEYINQQKAPSKPKSKCDGCHPSCREECYNCDD